MRIRKRLRSLRKKQVISAQEMHEIRLASEGARLLLEDERFTFFRNFLNGNKDSITKKFIEGSIKAVNEELTISDTLKRIFHITKKEQEDQLRGEYKFIEKSFDYILETERFEEDVVKAFQEGKLVIEGEEKEDE